MNRILAWIIIIAVAAAFSVAIGCAVDEGFKASTVNALNTISQGTYGTLSSAFYGLFVAASASGTTAAIYSIGCLVAGGLFFVLIKKFLWDKRPAFLGNKKVSAQKTYQDQLVASQPVVIKQPVIVQEPVVEKKEEEAKAAA